MIIEEQLIESLEEELHSMNIKNEMIYGNPFKKIPYQYILMGYVEHLRILPLPYNETSLTATNVFIDNLYALK